MSKRPLGCAIVLVTLSIALSSNAISFWEGPDHTNGGAPGNWGDSTNWQNSVPPTAGDGAFIGNGQAGDIKVNGTATIDASTGTAASGTLVLGSGTINAGGQDNGTLYISNGVLNLNSSASVNGVTLSFSAGGLGSAGGGGSGTLLMDNGTLNLTGTAAQSFLIGYSNSTTTPATGYVELTNGSSIGYSFVGNNKFSVSVRGVGTLNMTPTAGTINLNGGSFDISRAGGSATLLLQGGTISANILDLTTAAGSGTAIISGGQLTTTSTTHGAQGTGGTAYMRVSAGTFTSGSTMTLTEDLNTVGTLIVNGGRMGGTALSLSAGTNSFGSLNVQSGTLALSGALTVASGTTTIGNVLIQGGTTSMASATIASGTLNSNGTIAITGGRVNITNAVTMVNNPGSSATLAISGGAVVAGSFNVSGGSGTGTAKSFLSFSGSSTEVCLLRLSQSNNPATINFDGGTLTVGTFGCALHQAQWNGGTLSPGDFTQIGGGASFGTTLFTASNNSFFTQGAGHHIHIDLGDNGLGNPTTANKDYIQLNTSTAGSGTATLNGTIDVEFIGTSPVLGAVYDILKAAVANGIIDNSTLLSHTPGIEFSKSIVTTTNANDTLRLTITAVPEPATFGLVGLGAFTLLGRRSRRSRNSKPTKLRPTTPLPSRC